MENATAVLAILVPLAAIQLGLLAYALVDLARRDPAQINGPKWLWLVVILLVSLVGPVT